jgi:hypothetical protein
VIDRGYEEDPAADPKVAEYLHIAEAFESRRLPAYSLRLRWRITGVEVMPWRTIEARTTKPTTANRN